MPRKRKSKQSISAVLHRGIEHKVVEHKLVEHKADSSPSKSPLDDETNPTLDEILEAEGENLDRLIKECNDADHIHYLCKAIKEKNEQSTRYWSLIYGQSRLIEMKDGGVRMPPQNVELASEAIDRSKELSDICQKLMAREHELNQMAKVEKNRRDALDQMAQADKIHREQAIVINLALLTDRFGKLLELFSNNKLMQNNQNQKAGLLEKEGSLDEDELLDEAKKEVEVKAIKAGEPLRDAVGLTPGDPAIALQCALGVLEVHQQAVDQVKELMGQVYELKKENKALAKQNACSQDQLQEALDASEELTKEQQQLIAERNHLASVARHRHIARDVLEKVLNENDPTKNKFILSSLLYSQQKPCDTLNRLRKHLLTHKNRKQFTLKEIENCCNGNPKLINSLRNPTEHKDELALDQNPLISDCKLLRAIGSNFDSPLSATPAVSLARSAQ
jgi:hypothetical protein